MCFVLMFITVVISLLILLAISVKLMTFKKDSVSDAMATFAAADHLADGRLSVVCFIGVSNLRVARLISWLWTFNILRVTCFVGIVVYLSCTDLIFLIPWGFGLKWCFL